jgi:drug/metabolite transporter (DMT)-like permease
MTATNFILTLGTVLGIAAGQVLFKLGALTSNAAAGDASLVARHLNGYLVAAFAVYVIATVAWVYVLKTVPLNVAYPFMALAFVVVPLVAHFFVGEPLAWNHLVGGLVIGAGILIVQAA